MLNFDLTNKKKNEIQKLHLNFEIRVRQRSKFKFFFKGKLGDMTDQRSVWAKKIFCKETNRNSFFNFY